MRKAANFIVSIYGHPTRMRLLVLVGFCLIPSATLLNIELPQPYGLIAAGVCTALAPLAMILILHGLKPKHWVEVGHEFEINETSLKRYEEMLAWIARNARGRYKYTGSSIIFANSSDAVAYKLRWMF